jgi:hypothetical protein
MRAALVIVRVIVRHRVMTPKPKQNKPRITRTLAKFRYSLSAGMAERVPADQKLPLDC